MARRGFHSGSNNTVILFFFMDKKSLMCQDWINENGLFIWIWSEICKHLTIEFQEEDLRLGTKPRDLIRKWFKMIAQASRKVRPCVRLSALRRLYQHLSLRNSSLVQQFPWPVGILTLQRKGFRPIALHLGHHQDSEDTWNPITQGMLKKLWPLSWSREAVRGLSYVSSNIWRTVKWKRGWILILCHFRRRVKKEVTVGNKCVSLLWFLCPELC